MIVSGYHSTPFLLFWIKKHSDARVAASVFKEKCSYTEETTKFGDNSDDTFSDIFKPSPKLSEGLKESGEASFFDQDFFQG